jgi:hypothetical integral membrane protein (TIGR02206 family)
MEQYRYGSIQGLSLRLIPGIPPLMMLAAIDPGFRAFTPLHYGTVAGCVLIMASITGLGWNLQRHHPSAEKNLRHAIAWFCLGLYFAYPAWLWQPRNFRWEQSLPLEFCDMALLVAAGALLKKSGWLRGLLYFWATVFTLQAFITPVLQYGPTTPDFWLFWGAHLGIVGAAVYDVVVGKFRPVWTDVTRSYVISFFYAATLMILDALTGWNYGFVGPSKPLTPTLLDALGDYPLRIVWMLLITAVAYTLVWLPWAKINRTS